MPPGTPRGNVAVFVVAWGILVGGAALTALLLAAVRAPTTLIILPMLVLAALPLCVCRRPLLTVNMPSADNIERAKMLASAGDTAQGIVLTLAPGLMAVLVRTGYISTAAGAWGVVAWASFYVAYIGILVALGTSYDLDDF
jgi:hypothetical protein